MLMLENSPTIARTFRLGALGIPALALALGGCSRDEYAPDCSVIKAGICVVPGGEVATIDCAALPDGAVGAMYDHPQDSNASGDFSQWAATNLPADLSINPSTGTISGIPAEVGTINGIRISTRNINTGEIFEEECGPLEINPALNANPVVDAPFHCLDINTTKEQLLGYLDGGDGTEITCNPVVNNEDSPGCPLGRGNGRLAPGVSFNAETCTHSGSAGGTRRGTWVWMVEVTQSERSTFVPFCATNDVDTFHDISLLNNGEPQTDLNPGLYEYNPSASLLFGGGDYQWAIDDPACPGPACTNFGFRFGVNCSAFSLEAPWLVTLAPSAISETGLTHEMRATGPSPEARYDGRPWAVSFDISYCTVDNPDFCDATNNPDFEANAQTKYHFAVVAYPTL